MYSKKAFRQYGGQGPSGKGRHRKIAIGPTRQVSKARSRKRLKNTKVISANRGK